MLKRLTISAIAIVSAAPVAAGEAVELGTPAEALALLMQDDDVGPRLRIVPRFPISADYDRPVATRFSRSAPVPSRLAASERGEPAHSILAAPDGARPSILAPIPGWPTSRPEVVTSMFGPRFAVSDTLVLPRPPRRTGVGASVMLRLDGDEDTPIVGFGRATTAPAAQ